MAIKLILEKEDILKPCPFCGSSELELCNTWTALYWIECRNCGAQVDGIAYPNDERPDDHQEAKQSAIEFWNTRVSAEEEL